MKIYIIRKEEDNTYYTGAAKKDQRRQIKIPIFSKNENKAKIYHTLNKARLERANMSKYTKMSNVHILELHTDCVGVH